MRAYVAYRQCSRSIEDRIVAKFARGPCVHCEMAFLVEETNTAKRTLVAIGSIYPGGVYASDVFKDPFYGVCARDGKLLPVQIDKSEGEGGWKWHDISNVFELPHNMQSAFDWAIDAVGTSKYHTSAVLTFPLPCSFGVEEQTLPSKHKLRYTCSEFCADCIRQFAKDSALRHDIDTSSQRFWGVGVASTCKISPQCLYDIVERDGRAQEETGVSLRLLATGLQHKMGYSPAKSIEIVR